MHFLEEFEEFITRGNVVDLALGVVIGGAFGKIASSFVSDIILPPMGWFFNGVGLKDLKFYSVTYGNFLQTIIEFLMIALAIFCVIKIVRRMPVHRNKKREKNINDEVQVLKEIRDLLKRQ